MARSRLFIPAITTALAIAREGMYNYNMLDKVENTIKRFGLIGEGEKVLVGVSGGADSVALLHTLLALSSRMGFFVCAAHLNHGIRGEEAESDALFVKDLCELYGVELYQELIDVPSLAREHRETLEQAGRVARYDFLSRAKKRFGADKIAVAHHMDDQAESILLHLTRGSGLLGLTGMQPQRGDLIRPLLFLRRREIEAYLEKEGIAFCTDATNLERGGTRNRLRLDAIPYIEKNINPSIVESLCSMGELLWRDESYLAAQAEAALASAKSGAGYLRDELKKLPLPILTRCLRIALFNAGAKADIERVHIEKVIELLSSRTGATLSLPYVEAWTSYELVCFGASESVEWFELDLCEDGITKTPLGEFEAHVIDAGAEGEKLDFSDRSVGYMDMDKLFGNALIVRLRRDGDRFFPVGAPGRRKLKQFFIDRKVARDERLVPLICNGSDVFFVPGHCVSDDVKVDGSTRKILKVVYRDAKIYP